MDFRTVPFSNAKRSIHKARDELAATTEYSTHAHSYEEISAIVPETGELRHVKPKQ